MRITLVTSPTARVVITSARIIADVPDIEFGKAGFAVAPGGSTFTFATYDPRAFRSVPFVNVTPISSGFALPVVSAKTTTECTITLYDSAGSSISGTADVLVKGF